MAISGNMFSIGPPALSPLAAGTATPNAEAAAPGAGFSAALAQAQSAAEATGQGLAAGGAAAPLAVVSLGPGLRVITGGQAAMDSEALLAFAQQQGLSPQAIEASRLQMQHAGPEDAAANAVAAAMTLGPQIPGVTLTQTAQVAQAAQAAQAAPIAQASLGVQALPGAQAVQAAALFQASASPGAPVPAAQAGPVAADVASPKPTAHWLGGQAVPAGAGAGVLQGPAAPAPATPGLAGPTAAPAASAAVTGGPAAEWSGLVPMPQATSVTSPVAGSAASISAAPLPPQGAVLEVSLAGLWASGQGAALRELGAAGARPAPVTLDVSQAPALGVTQLPLKAAFQLPPAALLVKASAPAAALPSETLVLDGLSAADVTDLEAQAPALSRHSAPSVLSTAAHLPTPASPAGAPSPTAAMAEAQAKYEAVAQQLGEALAQRLHAQIQRGHWQLKLHLHPQELGSIDVQLGMRGGDLMASFQASQQMTRDMLQDQMPRLREMLASAGIDVASADVNAQSGGRSGGNSTQAEARGTAPPAGLTAAAEAEPTAVRTMQANDDRGLDLWA